MKPNVLLIGLDGATYSVLDPLMQDGIMPSLKQLVDRGARSVLTSVIPALTPPAWTSLMTGCSPGNHGIFDFLRFDCRSGNRQLRVLDSNDVAAETIWSVLSRKGLKTTVLNFPMTFPARNIEGNVVPGWVPGRHLRLACAPKSLFAELEAAIPGLAARELAMDMSLEERALEGCQREEDYEGFIELHIRRERQWFNVLRHLMREKPAHLTAVLFDGVDKLQHSCWRFLDGSLYPSAPNAAERRVREQCLEYFRTIDEFIGEIVAAGGDDASVVIASDHGFGPTVEVFHVNEWLHQHGYLKWANSPNVEQKHTETLGMGTMARRFYEIDWDNTIAYCPTPSGNGIYITPPSANGAGVSPEAYESVRRELIAKLLAFQDPATGQAPVTHIWTREDAFTGSQSAFAPDLTLVLRDGGLVSILPSDKLLKPRTEIAGAHRPEGVFIAAGQGIRRGANLPPQPILNVAPLLLHLLGLPIPQDVEGSLPAELFESDYLQAHPLTFEAPAPEAFAAVAQGSSIVAPRMDSDVMGHLRALGYME